MINLSNINKTFRVTKRQAGLGHAVKAFLLANTKLFMLLTISVLP